MVLTIQQKNEIIVKYNKLNMSMSDIANDLKISLNTVSFWIKRYKNDKTLNRKRGSGIYNNRSVKLVLNNQTIL
jgi:transposase